MFCDGGANKVDGGLGRAQGWRLADKGQEVCKGFGASGHFSLVAALGLAAAKEAPKHGAGALDGCWDGGQSLAFGQGDWTQGLVQPHKRGVATSHLIHDKAVLVWQKPAPAKPHVSDVKGREAL